MRLLGRALTLNVCRNVLVGFIDGVDEVEDLEVLGIDRLVLDEHLGFYESDERLPILLAINNDRDGADLLGLHQGHDLEEFVQRPEPAREEYIDFGGEREHGLTGEEMVE